ncbi:hypothetical protein HK104_009011 [Borealophlyctis nickersoniae]|nr:hypothetical protein HK104_009011 [Borealophlyctis nickersoniae]
MEVQVPLGLFGDIVPRVEAAAEAVSQSRRASRPGSVSGPATANSPDNSSLDAANAPNSPPPIHRLSVHRRLSTAPSAFPQGGSASDAFVATVRAARILNSPTTPATATYKAVYYDHLVNAYENGADDASALQTAALEARAATGTAKSSTVVGDSGDGMTARRMSISEGRASTAESPAASVPSGTMKLKELFSNVIRPTVADKRQMQLSQPQPGAGGGGNGGMSTSGPGPTTTDDKKTGSLSVSELRMLHRKIMLVMEDYEKVNREETEDRERSMLASYRRSIQAVEEMTRKKVIEEYGKLIDHEGCKSKISQLTRENNIMKEETKRVVNMNVDLLDQVQSLRLYKSTAESEHTLMIKELARRRMRCRVLRRRLKEAAQRERELTGQAKEEAGVGVVGRVSRSRRRVWGEGSQGGSLNASDAERTDVEKTDAEEGVTTEVEDTDGNDGGGGFTTYTDGSISDDDDVGEEEFVESDKRRLKRPNWNSSTASKLLSQKPAPSVIHIGEGDVRPPSPTVDDEKTKVDEPAPVNKNHIIKRLTEVLIKCLDDTQARRGYYSATMDRERDDIKLPNEEERGSSTDLTIHQRSTLIERLVSKETLIASLLRALEGGDTVRFEAGAAENDSTQPPNPKPSQCTRPASAPSKTTLSGAGAGVPTTETTLRPADFARPVTPNPLSRANSPVPADADIGNAHAASSGPGNRIVPPASHAAWAATSEFGTVHRWVERAATRPRSAPKSRHGLVGADIEAVESGGSSRLKWSSEDGGGNMMERSGHWKASEKVSVGRDLLALADASGGDSIASNERDGLNSGVYQVQTFSQKLSSAATSFERKQRPASAPTRQATAPARQASAGSTHKSRPSSAFAGRSAISTTGGLGHQSIRSPGYHPTTHPRPTIEIRKVADGWTVSGTQIGSI